MVTIENQFLTIKIKEKGAELSSVFNKETQLEYMWSGDPKVWGKTSPILFPIVGTLKHDTYFFNKKAYTLPRHGFARDCKFEIAELKTDAVVFKLNSSAESSTKYPFHFSLSVKYKLEDDCLLVTYYVKNLDKGKLYFSIGAHPAFKVPLTANTKYEDYYLEFNEAENFEGWPISKDGLIEAKSVSLNNVSNKINLAKKIFEKDAIVFKNLKSNTIALKSSMHNHGLNFKFEGFPFMGLWAAPNGDFVCIEPWCGIADSVDHDQQLVSKEGIEVLNANSDWSRSWHVKFY